MPKKATLPTPNQRTRDTAKSRASYRVKRIFQTIQGEGYWTGTPSVFVRFVGCNMWSGYESDRERDAQANNANCPRWCDTEFTPEGSATYTADELVQAVKDEAGPVRHIVCTGGEPLLQLDSALVRAFANAGFYVHVETNGTVSLDSAFSDIRPFWITCSPKLPAERVPIETMNELKLVVPDYHPDAYEDLADRVHPTDLSGKMARLLYVQPEDGPRQDEAMEQAVALVKDRPAWRISVQTHKVMQID